MNSYQCIFAELILGLSDSFSLYSPLIKISDLSPVGSHLDMEYSFRAVLNFHTTTIQNVSTH